mgnify:FL=1
MFTMFFNLNIFISCIFLESKPALSPPSSITNSSVNHETISNSYAMTQLQQMNPAAIPGLNYSHMPAYHPGLARSDPSIKVETPENLTAHAQYGTPSPGKHHLENEHMQSIPHSINSMGLPSNEAGGLGPVSVGAS